MSLSIRNLAYIKSKDPRLYEAFQDILEQVGTLTSQLNGNATGQPQAPPPVNSVKVVAQNGHFNVAITDQQQIYRGIQYFVEHADNPWFTNAVVEHIGTSRNANFFLGNVTRYFRAYSAYVSGPASAAAYHGSVTAPIAVTGGGSVGGPEFQASQGSGTGTTGVGLVGPGPVPFRSATGAPPIR